MMTTSILARICEMKRILMWAFVCLANLHIVAPGQVVQQSGITITSSAGVPFLVVDPMGKRLGTDPWTGSDVEEINASWYGYEDIDALSDSGGVEWRSCYLRSKNPDTLRSGQYLLCVQTTSDRPFSIGIGVSRGKQFAHLKRSGFAHATRPVTYRLSFSNDSTVAVTIDSVITEKTVTGGLVFSDWGHVSAKAKAVSNFGVFDTLRCSVVTVRWKMGGGFNLGAITSTAYGFAKYGDTVNQGGYTYQKFRTIQFTSLNWQAGQEYTLFEVAVNDPVGIGRFELTNALSGGEWFANINYMDKTDSLFYQPVTRGPEYQNK